MHAVAFLTAALAAVASAYVKPNGPLKGNPIHHPGLDEQVHKGGPYKITWTPTTKGHVTIVLLRGPSTNVQPLYPIVQHHPNNGHFVWHPKDNLEVDTTHYGLQLIVEDAGHKGQYQYSTQFGIAKKKHHNGGAGGEISRSEGPDGSYSSPPYYPGGPLQNTTTGGAYTTTTIMTDYTTVCPGPTTIPINPSETITVTGSTTLTITDCPCTISYPVTSTPVTYPPTSIPPPYPTTSGYNGTAPHPPSTISTKTGATSVYTPSSPPPYTPSAPPTTPSTPAGPTGTGSVPANGAAKLGMGFAVGAIGVAAAALAL